MFNNPGSMDGIGGFAPAEEKHEEPVLVNAEYTKLEGNMLLLAKDKHYDEIVAILKAVTEQYPEEFFTQDDEFKIRCEKLLKGFEEGGDGDIGNYYKMLDKVIKPFWKKVDAAGPDVIKGSFFDKLYTAY